MQLLVTFGSGQGKLYVLRKLVDATRRGGLEVGIGLGILGVILLASLVLLMPVFVPPDNFWSQPSSIFAVGVFILVAVGGLIYFYGKVESKFGSYHISEAVSVNDLNIKGEEEANIKWMDYYTIADIVSDGQRTTLNDWSKAIKNYYSLRRDHSGYWHNREEFVAPVASALVELEGGNLTPDESDIETLRVARFDRNVRVFALAIWGILAGVSIPMAWYSLWDALVELGRTVASAIINILNIIPFVSIPEAISKVVETQEVAQIFGVILVPLLFALWHTLIVFQAWSTWDRREADRMFKRQLPQPEKRSAGQATGFLWFAFIIPCLLSCIAIYKTVIKVFEVRTTAITGNYLFTLLGVGYFVIILFLLVVFGLSIWITCVTIYDLRRVPRPVDFERI